MNSTTAPSSSTQELHALTAPDVSTRCLHRFSNGKRCRLPGLESQSGLCALHFRLRFAAVAPSSGSADSSDLSPELLPELSESSSAMDLRKFLSRLLVLVAQGRISSRRAAVLSYITNQLLHSGGPAKKSASRQAAPLKSSLRYLARDVAEASRQ